MLGTHWRDDGGPGAVELRKIIIRMSFHVFVFCTYPALVYRLDGVHGIFFSYTGLAEELQRDERMVKMAYGIVVRVLVFLHCETKVGPQMPFAKYN